MSSINDALRMAERARESRLSVTAASLASARERRRKGKGFRTALAGAAAAVFLALALYSWMDSGSSRDPGLGMDAAPQQPSGADAEPETVFPKAEIPGPGEGLKLFRMGRVMHQAGRLAEARALYEDALRLDPEFVEAKNNLGVVLLAFKDYAAAEEAFFHVMDIRPDYVDAQYNLACLYALTGRMDEALKALSRAVVLDPGARDWALMDKDLAGLRKVPGFDRAVTIAD